MGSNAWCRTTDKLQIKQTRQVEHGGCKDGHRVSQFWRTDGLPSGVLSQFASVNTSCCHGTPGIFRMRPLIHLSRNGSDKKHLHCLAIDTVIGVASFAVAEIRSKRGSFASRRTAYYLPHQLFKLAHWAVHVHFVLQQTSSPSWIAQYPAATKGGDERRWDCAKEQQIFWKKTILHLLHRMDWSGARKTQA
jgi:hypothetical protein